jgi:hypothetical protein
MADRRVEWRTACRPPDVHEGPWTSNASASAFVGRPDIGQPWSHCLKEPFLSNTPRARRLEFAREHRKWTIEDWKKVIWTYESTFEVGKSSRQVLVWQKIDERYKIDCFTPIFKSGRTSIMVWGGFIATQKLSLICMLRGVTYM